MAKQITKKELQKLCNNTIRAAPRFRLRSADDNEGVPDLEWWAQHGTIQGNIYENKNLLEPERD